MTKIDTKGFDKNSKLQLESDGAVVVGGVDYDEDDMASAVSNPSPSPVVKAGPRGKARQAKVGNSVAGNHVPVRSTFSFENVFGYYPPKLVVRNGQLEPAYSLSVKNSDHSVLPESHPILKWTLGRPVRGTKKARKTAAS